MKTNRSITEILSMPWFAIFSSKILRFFSSATSVSKSWFHFSIICFCDKLASYYYRVPSIASWIVVVLGNRIWPDGSVNWVSRQEAQQPIKDSNKLILSLVYYLHFQFVLNKISTLILIRPVWTTKLEISIAKEIQLRFYHDLINQRY